MSRHSPGSLFFYKNLVGQFIFLQESGRAAYFLQKIWPGSSFYYNNEED